MVRLINNNNIKYIINAISGLLQLQDKVTYIREYNNPCVGPCVYVLWHKYQFCIHGIADRNKLNVLISTSKDGDIVAEFCTRMGYKVVRGSSGRKGSVSSTLSMIENLKKGENVAIMVDGPRGPLYEVKKGAIMIAREANVPIVPVYWYSTDPTYITIPSWDKMTSPLGPCRLLNVYGDPIYPRDLTDEEVAQRIRDSLFELEKKAPEWYKEAKEQKLWNK